GPLRHFLPRSSQTGKVAPDAVSAPSGCADAAPASARPQTLVIDVSGGADSSPAADSARPLRASSTIAQTNAVIGTARNAPTTPAEIAPAVTAARVTIGCSWTLWR